MTVLGVCDTKHCFMDTSNIGMMGVCLLPWLVSKSCSYLLWNLVQIIFKVIDDCHLRRLPTAAGTDHRLRSRLGCLPQALQSPQRWHSANALRELSWYGVARLPSKNISCWDSRWRACWSHVSCCAQHLPQGRLCCLAPLREHDRREGLPPGRRHHPPHLETQPRACMTAKATVKPSSRAVASRNTM